MKACDCQLALCDVSTLGIAAAHLAGIPVVLIENFTWDWIYTHTPEKNESLEKFAAYLKQQASGVDYHIQVQPVCLKCNANLTTHPLSRRPHNPSGVKAELGLPDDARYVLITMGGFREHYDFLNGCKSFKDLYLTSPRG